MDFSDEASAAPRPRRRRIDPLGVLVGFALTAIFVLIGVVVAGGGVKEKPEQVTEVAGVAPTEQPPVVAPLPPAQLLEKLDQKPVTSKKAKLLKSELKKRAESDVAKLKSSTVAVAGRQTEVLLSGDEGLRRAMRSKLKGVRFDVDGSRGFQLSLRSDSGSQGSNVYTKCSAAISELPARKLVASLSSRADAGGDGSDDDELKRAAMDACAASLADDVSKWLRTHR